jgi:hypothetical protein
MTGSSRFQSLAQLFQWLRCLQNNLSHTCKIARVNVPLGGRCGDCLCNDLKREVWEREVSEKEEEEEEEEEGEGEGEGVRGEIRKETHCCGSVCCLCHHRSHCPLCILHHGHR